LSSVLMVGASYFWKSKPIGGTVLIAIALMASIPSVKAAELWDFIRVGKNFLKGPTWQSRSGKAVVEIGKGQINIRVTYSDV
jgi:hypothetical protein